MYLLEKSRVTTHAKSERNYHIFYSFCRFSPREVLEKYKLLNSTDKCDMTKYNYLNRGDVYEVPSINDRELLKLVLDSFKSLNFSASEIDAVWSVIGIVLNLGNVEISKANYKEGVTPCNLKSSQYLTNVLSLMEVSVEDLEKA